MKKATENYMAIITGFIKSRAMKTWFYSMNIFMVILVQALVPVIKQDGHHWWQI